MKVVVIGGGPGGYVAALRAAIEGAEVTVVEKSKLGGTCLNVGCIPTKAMLASSGVLDVIKEAGKMGIKVEGTAEPDFTAIMDRKDKVVTGLVQGIEMLFMARGVNRIAGTGKLDNEGKLMVETEEGSVNVPYDKLILATGSVPVVPGLFPYDGDKIITSDEALYLKELPESMIIVGGGVIGCELGQFFAKCGTKVTVIEALPQLLPNEDPEIAQTLAKAFRKNKITVSTGKLVTACSIDADEVEVTLEDGKQFRAEKVLVCIGRKPNIQGLDLEGMGIEVNNGKVVTNEFMQTYVENVYAIGDIVNSPMLAHVASQEGIVAVEHMFGKAEPISYKAVPRCVYTTPEVACAGLTETQCKQKSIGYKVGLFQFIGLGKAKAAGKTDGFVKVIVDEKDVLIGASVVGEHATELLAELTMAIELGLTAKQAGRVIHPHPTMCEAIMEALHQVHGVCVHSI
ncbi:MAG: dihydrolipoyl dehydrogenase [Firmicutes bacterium]|nr:dihydrolipoyl dehydrogenase [Bacillota bacterium]